MTQRNAVLLAVMAALSSLGGTASAGGFAIGVQSGSATGNAATGGAAVAEDASVVWSNPAGMMHLKQSRQLTSTLHIIKPSFKFENTGSTGVFAGAGTGEGGNAGDWAYIPTAFATTAINPRMRVGVGITTPFGLTTTYEQGWRGQLVALKSQIQTVNVNPAVAYRVNDMLSVGAGVSVQLLRAKLSSFAGAALGNADLEADDVGFGYNFGAMLQVTPQTRVGVSYRSRIKYSLEGDVNFTGPSGPGFNGNFSGDLTVPESASLSVFHRLNREWELMADATRTGWDRLQQLTLVRTTPSAGGAAGSTLSTLDFGWKDVWRYGVGANYIVRDGMKIRVGLAFDETPTNDVTRTPRLPDQDRRWVAVGLHYQVPRAGVLEVGYAHEFLKDATVNNAVGGSRLIGRFDSKVDILSLQYSHPF